MPLLVKERKHTIFLEISNSNGSIKINSEYSTKRHAMYGLNDRKTLFLWQINSVNDGVSATGGIMVVEDDKASSMSESGKRMSG